MSALRGLTDSPKPVVISTSQRRRIVWLLGQYQELVESMVDSLIVPGTNDANPHCADEVAVLAEARRNWQRAEKLVARLQDAERVEESQARRGKSLVGLTIPNRGLLGC
jgi:hypothetical protein